MILFLDFDGVLHPSICKEEQLFCQLPMLEELLRDFPEVVIVISATWRNYQTLEQLKKYFSNDIAQRIIGITEKKNQQKNIREQEIKNYLEQHGLQHESWVALDDTSWEFPTTQEKLIKCAGYKGIDSVTIKELRKSLKSL